MLFKLKVIENLTTLHQKYGEKQFENNSKKYWGLVVKLPQKNQTGLNETVTTFTILLKQKNIYIQILPIC